MTTHEKLIEAWKIAPIGAKSIVYKKYTQQNVSDILDKGRKDEKMLSDLLEAIKKASAKVAKSIAKQNNKIQDL